MELKTNKLKKNQIRDIIIIIGVVSLLSVLLTIQIMNTSARKKVVESNALRPDWQTVYQCQVNGNNMAYFPEVVVGSVGTEEKNFKDSNMIFVWDKDKTGTNVGYYVSITNFELNKCSDKNKIEIKKGDHVNISKAQITNTLYNKYPLVLVDRNEIEKK